MALKHSTIVLQDGPIKEVGVNGDQIDDLIEFCLETLKEFNQPPYTAPENDIAILNLEAALDQLAKRTVKRVARSVEGTSKP